MTGGPRTARRPRISVAIPTRGRAAWCVDAARSALAQQGVEVEVVVAMDGEDPETRERLGALDDPRVRVVAHAAAGRSATRNLAWRSCQADRVALLDDDDLLLPDSLAVRSAALEREPGAALCHGDAIPADESGRPLRRVPSVDGDASVDSTREDALAMQWRGRSLLPSTVLARREALERAGGFPEDMPTGEDWLLFLRAAALGPFVHVRAAVVLYRRHGGQVRWDPAQQEAALPVLVARYFDDPRTPPGAARWRKRFEARLLAYIARNFRRRGQRADASRCLRAAVARDPRLLVNPRRLRHWLAALLRS